MNFERPAWLLLCSIAPTIACQSEPPLPDPTDEVRARAERLAQQMLIVDTHVDVPYRLQEEMADISQPTEGGDFDYPRAKAGGLDAPFMSIYVPASYEEGGAKALADELIDMVEGFVTESPDKFGIARSPDEVLELRAAGKMALPMGMENGAPLGGDLDNLHHFFDRGIRYITLTHSENNHISDSSYASQGQWNGLSPFGAEVVAEMNRLGMMIDVSHISDQAFYRVMELSQAPVIASHSSCRKFTPGFERNMDDDMIRLLAEKGGVIQINFGSAFLTAAAQEQSSRRWAEAGAYVEEHGLTPDDPKAIEFLKRFDQEHPPIFADISDVVAHIDHVVALAGVDHVGLGSDFDGVGDSLPTGLKDVSAYPNLIYELLQKGYSEQDIEKIVGGNLMRVWREVERRAVELTSDA